MSSIYKADGVKRSFLLNRYFESHDVCVQEILLYRFAEKVIKSQLHPRANYVSNHSFEIKGNSVANRLDNNPLTLLVSI